MSEIIIIYEKTMAEKSNLFLLFYVTKPEAIGLHIRLKLS